MSISNIKLSSVSKRFGQLVLADVSLEFKPGKAYLLTGPNGAGKTTLLNILAGISSPTSGSVTYHSTVAAARISIVSDRPMLYGDLTIKENLELFGNLYNVVNPLKAIEYFLDKFNLSEFLSRRVRTLSSGLLYKTSLLRALLNDPAVLLLDEPLSHIDEAGFEALTTVLDPTSPYHKPTRITVIASHRTELLYRYIDEIITIVNGSITGTYKTKSTTFEDYINRKAMRP